ncbi:MAG: ATP-binding protein [Clostridiales bacterium]
MIYHFDILVKNKNKLEFFALNKKWNEEAIFNILDNAIKYSSEDSKILISIVKYELFCRIEIIDLGCGIWKMLGK